MTLSRFLEAFPGLAFVADADGTLIQWSEGLSRRLGGQLEQASLTSLVTADDREAVAALLRELADADEPVSRVLRFPQADGEHATLRCLARRSPEGEIVAQLEPVAEAPDSAEATRARIERALFRTIMNTLEIVVWAVKPSGEFVFHDGKALATAGLERGQFVGMNVFELYPPELIAPIEAALAGTPSHYTSEAHEVHWESWMLPLDNAAGETEYAVGLTLDVSETVRTEAELKHQLETIQRQQQAIHELSAPLIEVWDGVMTVPLIGLMDRERTDELSERLLNAVSRSNIRFAILDLTGVEILDTSIANHILRMLSSLRLLGVEGVLTGISPRVAQTMTGLGIELGGIRTYRSLRDGLRHCIHRRRRPRGG